MLCMSLRYTMVKAIIFDWGRTLWDNDNSVLFPDSKDVLEYLKMKGYRLAVLSISLPERFEQKYETIANSGLARYFDKVLVSTKKEKEEIDEINRVWNFEYKDIAIIGDQVIREVAVANKLGMKSILVKRGKFADQITTQETGTPTHTISTVAELKSIL